MTRTTIAALSGLFLVIDFGGTVGLAGESALYRLLPGTVFGHFCELCDCLDTFSEEVDGAFVLTPAGLDGDFARYTVSALQFRIGWVTGWPLEVTGEGEYRVGGTGIAEEQELKLDLKVGDEEIVRYRSGLVPVQFEFPDLRVAVSIHVEPVCRDSEFRLVAARSLSPPTLFLRGDCNADGVLDVTDPSPISAFSSSGPSSHPARTLSTSTTAVDWTSRIRS